jgi:AcrR family transcriptional regulator
MRRVQAAALELFGSRGFDAVSIDEIAAASDVGPATIYRNFGTKERLVLWDEYDPLLLALLQRELEGGFDVVEAARRALSAALSKVYQRDRVRIRQRALLIRITPALQQAAAADLRPMRLAIAEVLLRKARDRLEAEVWGAAIVGALEVALDRWLDKAEDEALARSIDLAFRRLRRVGSGAVG